MIDDVELRFILAFGAVSAVFAMGFWVTFGRREQIVDGVWQPIADVPFSQEIRTARRDIAGVSIVWVVFWSPLLLASLIWG